VLHAYFDESGIHGDSRTTIVCGFIGSRNQWRRLALKWRKTMNGRVFHYKHMRHQTSLVEKLASIVDDSSIQAIAGGFSGDWDRAINSGNPEWPKRFPSCYQFILEACVQRLQQFSHTFWNGEPITLIFSRQDQYAKHAEKIWAHYKQKQLWKGIVGFRYGDPATPELQAADLLAYEVFQTTRTIIERNQPLSPAIYQNWPMARRLVASRRLMLGTHFTESMLIETLSEQDKHPSLRYSETVLTMPKVPTPVLERYAYSARLQKQIDAPAAVPRRIENVKSGQSENGD
jgi:hypothetical protein